MRRRLFWLAIGAVVGVAAPALMERRIRRAVTRLGAGRLGLHLANRPVKAVEQLRRLRAQWADFGRSDPGPTSLGARPLRHPPAPYSTRVLVDRGYGHAVRGLRFSGRWRGTTRSTSPTHDC